jgi:hypothetical protein
MSLTKLVTFVAAAAACGGPSSARAEMPLELADLAGRIDYGYYVDDAQAIANARAPLARMSDDDFNVRYYRAFAAFRLAQLSVQHGKSAAAFGADCVKDATVEETGERLTRAQAEAKAKASAEAWILVAACSGLAAMRPEPGRALEQDRRGEQALARAKELDASNPRIALVDAWLVSLRPAAAEPEARDEASKKLAAAVAAFDAWSPPQDAPDWGAAEALAALAEVSLARGEVRGARDLIERALLLAPDYKLAVELRARLQGARSAAR